jgi:hypothetical protein
MPSLLRSLVPQLSQNRTWYALFEYFHLRFFPCFRTIDRLLACHDSEPVIYVDEHERRAGAEMGLPGTITARPPEGAVILHTATVPGEEDKAGFGKCRKSAKLRTESVEGNDFGTTHAASRVETL